MVAEWGTPVAICVGFPSCAVEEENSVLGKGKKKLLAEVAPMPSTEELIHCMRFRVGFHNGGEYPGRRL